MLNVLTSLLRILVCMIRSFPFLKSLLFFLVCFLRTAPNKMIQYVTDNCSLSTSVPKSLTFDTIYFADQKCTLGGSGQGHFWLCPVLLKFPDMTCSAMGNHG